MALRIGYWVYHRANNTNNNSFEFSDSSPPYVFTTSPSLPGTINIDDGGYIVGTHTEPSIAVYELQFTNFFDNTITAPLQYEIYFD